MSLSTTVLESAPSGLPPVQQDDVEEDRRPKRAPLVIFCISCITFISCYLGGLVTVSVPQISKDLQLDPGMELWYSSLAPMVD